MDRFMVFFHSTFNKKNREGHHHHHNHNEQMKVDFLFSTLNIKNNFPFI